MKLSGHNWIGPQADRDCAESLRLSGNQPDLMTLLFFLALAGKAEPFPGVSTFPVVGLAHTFKVCVFGRPGTLADLKVCASRVAWTKMYKLDGKAEPFRTAGGRAASISNLLMCNLSPSFLPVIGAATMLATIMLVMKVLRDGYRLRGQVNGVVGYTRHGF